MIQYSCVHVKDNFFPDYVFLAYLYARNITKEKVVKIMTYQSHSLRGNLFTNLAKFFL